MTLSSCDKCLFERTWRSCENTPTTRCTRITERRSCVVWESRRTRVFLRRRSEWHETDPCTDADFSPAAKQAEERQLHEVRCLSVFLFVNAG